MGSVSAIYSENQGDVSLLYFYSLLVTSFENISRQKFVTWKVKFCHYEIPCTFRISFRHRTYMLLIILCYRPQRNCGQGYVFTRVCDSVHGGEEGVGLSACRDTTTTTPPTQKEAPPPREGRPPPLAYGQ